MSARMYVITEDLASARQAVEILLAAGLDRDGIGVVCQRMNVSELDLPEADLTQTSDVGPAAARGAALGSATGLLAGLTAVAFPPAGLVIGGAAVAGIAALGTGVGAWSATMIGVSEQSEVRKRFDDAVSQGKFLLIADGSLEKVKAAEKAVRATKLHGTATEAGIFES